MNGRYLAYNPALLTDAELLETFVVRQVDLQLVIETIRDNDESSNQHLVVVGARGMGKTTLVSRVALAVKHDPALGSRWTPVLFGEESYDVGSVGELWLKALQRLAETVGGSRWQEAFETVRAEKDEERLRERALGRLLDYARDSQTRILLVAENLDMMLSEQLTPDDAWTLRHALQQHPEIMLIATAVEYASVFGQRNLPLYGFAREHRLQPLTLAETRALWTHVANEERGERAMIPIHRLTGGNPRLVTIVASFSAGRSFRQLMDELTALIDEHTSYFKATIEALPPVERRVYSTLADLWAPGTSRQVAERCRMSVSKASALLARLMARGMVEEVDKSRRIKRFQLVERLYNVYHVLRNRGGEQRTRLKGVVEFMALFYESDGLAEIMGKLALEATELPHEQWGEYLEVYALLMEKLPDQRQVLRVTPDVFLTRLLESALPISEVPERLELVKASVDFLDSPNAQTSTRAHAALAAYFEIDVSQAVDRLLDALTSESPMLANVPMFNELRTKVLVPTAALLLCGVEDEGKAISGLRRLSDVFPRDIHVLVGLTVRLDRAGHFDEALVQARTLAESHPRHAGAWGLLGHVLESKEDETGAAAAYRKSLKQSPDPRIQLRLAAILARTPGHLEEVRRLADEVVFDKGELPRWLAIARAETDLQRGVVIAKQIVTRGDIAASLAALELIFTAQGDGVLALNLLRDTIESHPNCAGAAACMTMRLVLGKPFGFEEAEAWPLLEALLKHPQWKVEPLRMGILAGVALLRWGRVDAARVLTLLQDLDVDAATNPVVVAVRMALGGDVSDVPAELLQIARDVLSEHTASVTPFNSRSEPRSS